MTDTIKVKAVEVNGQELAYAEEKTLSVENIITESNIYGQNDLTQILDYIKNNAALNNYIQIANGLVMTNSTVYVDLPGLAITPDTAGTYICLSAVNTYHQNNNRLSYFDIEKNDIPITSSESILYHLDKNVTLTAIALAEVTVNGTTDEIKVKWHTNNNTLNATTRFLFMLRTS